MSDFTYEDALDIYLTMADEPGVPVQSLSTREEKKWVLRDAQGILANILIPIPAEYFIQAAEFKADLFRDIESMRTLSGEVAVALCEELILRVEQNLGADPDGVYCDILGAVLSLLEQVLLSYQLEQEVALLRSVA